MRQAGRYLPGLYRISMGMHVDMVNGQRLILEVDVIASMGYLLEAITLTRKKLDGRCPLVGFCGAPWTLMCYMTDTSNNGGAKNYNSSRRWLYKYPEQSRFLLGKIATIVGNLLAEQARAGAQILMVFDSHAGVLNRQLFNYFLMGPLTEIIRIVKESNISVPLVFTQFFYHKIYFAKGGHYVINELLETQFDVIALDWSIEPREIKSTNKTLMGNLDPAALYGSKV
ncbi:hypothetical protein MXB_2202 [Myxobolus squamalis]|nr:hypothetical protein MXB_2202 [Myxobolus squamalis]